MEVRVYSPDLNPIERRIIPKRWACIIDVKKKILYRIFGQFQSGYMNGILG